MLVEIKDPK